MTPNPSTRWGELVVQGLVDGGLETAVIAPGSRSTPLVVAADRHEAIHTYSILDERSAAYFALGRAKLTGQPTAVICTSGTAGANMHPAVLEADTSGTPLIVCTADRPADLHEAGANQTIDQSDLYGNAVRWNPTIPPATSDTRSMDAARITTARATHRSLEPHPGPVHLNIPFRKPLSPTEVDPSFNTSGTSTQSVTIGSASIVATEDEVTAVRDRLHRAERPLLVAGPLSPWTADRVRPSLPVFDIPILADPLSCLRFVPPEDAVVLGGYDAFLDALIDDRLPGPDLVIRIGARPTSVTLRNYLRSSAPEHVYVDPSGSYADPEFSTSEIVPGDPADFLARLAREVPDIETDSAWTDGLRKAEQAYWDQVRDASPSLPDEGAIAHHIVSNLPEHATLFVSNSMPIRDVDRFGAPSTGPGTVLGNRGVSGIDGITSSAIGAASTADGPAVLLTGDLAFYHDMNGLLALGRCNVDLTIVVVNNDGGGIFHMLPVSEVDPPFTEHFLTPHGIDISKVAHLYDIQYREIAPDEFADQFSPAEAGSEIVEVPVDGESSHDQRETFQHGIRERLGDVIP